MGAERPSPVDTGMDIRVRVGLNLQNARHNKGLSQEDLAHAAGVHQTYLSGVERGRRNPSLLILERLAKALAIDIEELTKQRPRAQTTSR